MSAWTPANRVWGVFFGCLLLNLVVVLCFHAAQFDKRYMARYSLPTHAFDILSSGLSGARPWVWSLSVVLTTLFIMGVTWSKNGQALYTKANFMIAEQHWLEAVDASDVSGDSFVIDRFNTAWSDSKRSCRQANKGAVALGRALRRYRRRFGSTIAPATAALRGAFTVDLLGEQSLREGHLPHVYRLPRSKSGMELAFAILR